MLKFKMYGVNTNGNLVPMELSDMGKFNLVLLMNGKKMRFGYMSTDGSSNVRIGELMFSVPQKDAEILVTSQTREFYITLVASDNTETVMYEGFWNTLAEKDIVRQNEEAAKEQYAQLLGMPSPFTSVVSSSSIRPTAESLSEASVAGLQINIPGYVPASSSKNDISIVNVIRPANEASSANTSQAKADAAKGKILGNQGIEKK